MDAGNPGAKRRKRVGGGGGVGVAAILVTYRCHWAPGNQATHCANEEGPPQGGPKACEEVGHLAVAGR